MAHDALALLLFLAVRGQVEVHDQEALLCLPVVVLFRQGEAHAHQEEVLSRPGVVHAHLVGDLSR